MNKLAFIFAGQGSQYQGMGLDFLEASEDLKKLSHQADDILGFHTEHVIKEGSELLNETRFTQPLVLLASIYAYETVKKLNVKPDAVLGFSLGEYTAFYAASIFNFKEIMELINMRALMMDEASKTHQGLMAAVLGLSAVQIDQLCQDIKDIYPANYNSFDQTVISGTTQGIEEAEIKAKAYGAKRLIKLKVSGAFHSPLMNEASSQFENELKGYHPKKPLYDLYLNTTGKLLDLPELKEEMVKQIISPVRFVQVITEMKKDGFTHFVEIGPGKVLSGLIKKIDNTLEVTHVEKYADINELKGWLSTHGFIK